MRKIKEILRLKHELGLGLRQIARSQGLSHSTVSDYLARAEAAGITWPLPEDLDEAAVEARLFPGHGEEPRRRRPEPDWAWVHRELRRKGVTLQLLWLEYKQEHPDGYQYSRFCDLYHRWRQTLDIPLRQVHRAGEKVFVDWAGQTVPVVDPATGEVREAYVFVGALGASNYTYAEASFSQDLRAWILAHCRMFEFFGGVPRIVVPDNPKTAVTQACRYEPGLNRSYEEMAAHYGAVVLPARPKKPRDKAKVETAVQMVERWVLAPLRHRTFFSLAELNRAIREGIEALNDRPFQKLAGSRRTLFEALDRPALLPLPARRYEHAEWKRATVNIDHHVEVDHNYYSVPHRLVRREVEVRLTATTVEVLHRGQRVASHVRSYGRGQYLTDERHRPAAHQRHLEWTPSRLIRWAEAVGPETARLVRTLLETRPHPEQGYRSCLGIIRLGRRFGSARLEAACGRALLLGALSYRSVRSILEKGLDRLPLEAPGQPPAPIRHPNLRGARYYGDEGGASSC